MDCNYSSSFVDNTLIALILKKINNGSTSRTPPWT